MDLDLDLTKIFINLEKYQNQKNKEFWVLVMNGSFNPVHLHHIEALNLAKKQIEETKDNVIVIGAYLCTSSDEYVKYKLGRQFISNDHRYNMLKLATQDSDFIEACGFGIASARDVLRKIKIILSSQIKRKIKVIGISGADYANRSSSKNMVVVTRGRETAYSALGIVVRADLTGSSTQIREGKDYSLLHPKVYQYLVDHQLFL